MLASSKAIITKITVFIFLYSLNIVVVVAKSCLILCDPMDCSMPDFPALHHLLEFAQLMSIKSVMPSNHLILCHSLLFPTFNLSQHQGLFRWVCLSHQMAKVLEFQIQHQAFQWIFRTDLLQDGLVGSPCSPRDSQESSPTPQFKSINSSVLSFLCNSNLTSIHDYWKNHSFD